MLRINRQTDYAVLVIHALAKRGEGTRLSTAEIQRETLIPPELITYRLVGLDKGCILERGSHTELITSPGLYSRLIRLQNQILSDEWR